MCSLPYAHGVPVVRLEERGSVRCVGRHGGWQEKETREVDAIVHWRRVERVFGGSRNVGLVRGERSK